MDTRRTDLDGLATFWTEGPGPAMAWLVFRVGCVDETLSTRGITQLTAGVAIEGVESGGAAYGAFAGGPTSSFMVDGTPTEVKSILGHVWADLASSATELLEEARERQIRYAGWRRATGVDQLLALRFGPRGPGLSGQPEIGMHSVDAAAVLAWRRRYLTPRNAALALKNVAPEDLGLSQVPAGEWRPAPEPEPLALELPAWSGDNPAELAVSSVLPGSGTVDAFTSAAVRRLREKLGEGHRVDLSSVRLGPGLDHVSIHCSAPEGTGARVRDALVEVLDELASAGPRDAEIAERRRRLREWSSDPESAPARLEWTAHRHVLDPAGKVVDALDEPDPPSAADVAGIGQDFLATAIYLVPPGVGMPPGCHHLSGSSEDAVTGTAYEYAGDARSGSLVVGSDGVTMTIEDRRVTIRYDRCEAASQWPDGTLDLYGSDGFGAQVRPREWVDGQSAVAVIAERVSDRLIVMRPPPRA